MEVMKPYRRRIDALDDKIIDLLVERIGIIREVGHFKYDNDIPAVLPDRVIEVRERAAERAAAKGLDPELVRQLYNIIIHYSCNLEEDIKVELARSGRRKASSF